MCFPVFVSTLKEPNADDPLNKGTSTDVVMQCWWFHVELGTAILKAFSFWTIITNMHLSIYNCRVQSHICTQRMCAINQYHRGALITILCVSLLFLSSCRSSWGAEAEQTPLWAECCPSNEGGLCWVSVFWSMLELLALSIMVPCNYRVFAHVCMLINFGTVKLSRNIYHTSTILHTVHQTNKHAHAHA